MKKSLLFIFVLFYFGVASGATMEFHYCMGNLVEWGIAHQEETKSCSKCKMLESDSKNCCKKQQQDVKIEKAQKAEFSHQFKVDSLLVVQSFGFKNDANIFYKTQCPVIYRQVSPLEKTPIFIFLRTFRI
ncbi:MAG: hypothetical protein H7096_12855 [Flavobacterium sp.]|nr:hypothetical protein [Pedobacter sp.]